MNIPPVLQQVWDNPYASFAIIIVGSLLAAKLISWLVAKTLVQWAASTEGTDLDDKLVALLEPVVVKCIVIGGVLMAVHRTRANLGLQEFLSNLLLSVIIIIVRISIVPYANTVGILVFIGVQRKRIDSH